MVQSEFQQNTKTLMVPTSNIYDQKHSRIIIRTSLWNSRNSFKKMFFSSQKLSTKGYVVHGFKRTLNCSWFLQTAFLIINTVES